MKNFQIVLLIVFGLFAMLALAFFSGGIELPTKARDSVTGGASGTVTLWGTIPASSLRDTIDFINSTFGGEVVLKYVEKEPSSYRQSLLDAFAFGGAPDLILLPNDLINLYQDKIVLTPYSSFSDRVFNDSYVQAANVFKTEAGILGFPILVDPLVMFYNKDHFDSKGISKPPTIWKDLTQIVPALTEKNEVLEIKRSGLAFGESVNVRNFKEIISALNLQLGNNIIVRNFQTASFQNVFAAKSAISSKPAEESLRYYLEFSNPLKSTYSWNKSMPDSLQAFIAGDLSVYFGMSSEAPLIARMNPNLNFDVSLIPQVEGSPNFVTYADVYAVSITRNTKNFNAASYVASQLANTNFASPLSMVTSMAPARRDLLKPNLAVDKFMDIYYKAALQSRSWAIPEKTETEKVFAKMIESVLSGLNDYPKAVVDAAGELNSLIVR